MFLSQRHDGCPRWQMLTDELTMRCIEISHWTDKCEQLLCTSFKHYLWAPQLQGMFVLVIVGVSLCMGTPENLKSKLRSPEIRFPKFFTRCAINMEMREFNHVCWEESKHVGMLGIIRFVKWGQDYRADRDWWISCCSLSLLNGWNKFNAETGQGGAVSAMHLARWSWADPGLDSNLKGCPTCLLPVAHWLESSLIWGRVGARLREEEQRARSGNCVIDFCLHSLPDIHCINLVSYSSSKKDKQCLHLAGVWVKKQRDGPGILSQT